VRLGDGRAWLFFALPHDYPESAPIARIEAASGPPLPDSFAGSVADTVAEFWSPGEICVHSCCVAVEERLRELGGGEDPQGGAEPEPTAGTAECTVPVEQAVAAQVGPSLLSVGFQTYPGGLFSHPVHAITVYVVEGACTVTVDGILTEDLTDWLNLQLEDVQTFGRNLVEWTRAQRADGFVPDDEEQAPAGGGLDYLPSAEALKVQRSRELTILTWGKAFRKTAPPESQANFNAGILNGRGGGADIRVDNGLTEAVQNNVASCNLFPRWLEMVITKIETEGLGVVSINCTKGRHRSVAAAEILRREYYPNAAVVHTSPAIKR